MFFYVSVWRKATCFVGMSATRGRTSPSPVQIHLLLYSLSCHKSYNILEHSVIVSIRQYFPYFVCVCGFFFNVAGVFFF